MGTPVTLETIFTLSCLRKSNPDRIIPVFVVASSAERAIELLIKREPEIDVIGVTSGHQMAVLLAAMGDCAKGVIKPFAMEEGFEFASVF